jgi:hypothetical protein
LKGSSGSDSPAAVTGLTAGEPDAFEKTFDDFESYMADIHAIAETGKSLIEPMRTKKPKKLRPSGDSKKARTLSAPPISRISKPKKI